MDNTRASVRSRNVPLTRLGSPSLLMIEVVSSVFRDARLFFIWPYPLNPVAPDRDGHPSRQYRAHSKSISVMCHKISSRILEAFSKILCFRGLLFYLLRKPIMWQVKKFRTILAGRRWIKRNEHRIQWQEVFVNNVPFAVEYRQLRTVY